MVVTALLLIGGFNVFDIVFVMTGGGPANATEVIATLTGRPDGGLGGQPRTFALIQTGHGEDDKNWLMHLMTEKRVRHIPVTDPEGILMGIVSIGDVVKSRLSELEGERQALLEYITKG